MYINYYNYNNNTNSDFYREIHNYNIKYHVKIEKPHWNFVLFNLNFLLYA